MGQEQIISIAIGAIVFTTMIVIGLDVTLQEFKHLFKKPRPILIGFLAPALVVPIAVWLIQVTSLPAHIEAGILLVVICPTGNFSNVYASISRCNTPLSITLSVATPLLAFVTMPLWMWAYGYLLEDTLEFHVPTSVLFFRLFILLALPVAAGMWMRSRFPDFERKCHRLLKRFAFIGIILLGGYIIFSDSKGFSEDFGPTAIAAVALTLITMAVSYLTSRIARLDHRDSLTLVLVNPVRNLAIAIAIAVSILHQTQFAVFATAMFMTQLPVLMVASLLIRRFAPPSKLKIESGAE